MISNLSMNQSRLHLLHALPCIAGSPTSSCCIRHCRDAYLELRCRLCPKNNTLDGLTKILLRLAEATWNDISIVLSVIQLQDMQKFWWFSSGVKVISCVINSILLVKILNILLQEWERQLPHHLSLPPAGPSFYAQVFHPAFNVDAEDATDAVDRFDNHTRAIGKGVQGLRNIFRRVREARTGMSRSFNIRSYL